MRELIEQTLLDNYEKYYRLAYSYVKNEQDALDVVQESAYRSMKHWKKVREPQYIETWIYRIVTNTALNLLKKQKRCLPYEADLSSSYEENLVDKNDVLSMLDCLEEKDRTIIILRFFEDLKIDQIAHVIGENTNTTKSRLYRALQKLRINVNAENFS